MKYDMGDVLADAVDNGVHMVFDVAYAIIEIENTE